MKRPVRAGDVYRLTTGDVLEVIEVLDSGEIGWWWRGTRKPRRSSASEISRTLRGAELIACRSEPWVDDEGGL